MTNHADDESLMRFDALRLGLGYVHGLERVEIRRRLITAGMILYRAADGCECWDWPRARVGACVHRFTYHATTSPCRRA